MKWSPSQVLEYGNILHYRTKQYAIIMVLTRIFVSLLLADLLLFIGSPIIYIPLYMSHYISHCFTI